MSEMQQAAVAARKSKMSVRDICYAGLFAAVIAVMAQISIPMPMGVPMTMQTFAITLAAVVLGSKLSTISSLIYIIMGAVGLPVLANFSGGFDKFVGPTGGFLISFPLMAYIIGLGVEHRDAFKGAFVTAVIVGTVVTGVLGLLLVGSVLLFRPGGAQSLGDLKYLYFGIALVVMMILRPQGLFPARQKLLAYGRQVYRAVRRPVPERVGAER